MPMGQPPGASAEAQPGSEPAQPGGASQIVADVHSGLLKLMDMLGSKFPEDAQQLSAIVQQFQSFVDGLGQSPDQGGAPQGAQQNQEQGAAKGAVPAPY